MKVKVETESGGHTGTIVGLIAAGAAIGATGALVARRRNRAKWAEYEPSALTDDANAMLAKTRGGEHAGEGASGKASKIVSWARGTAGSAVGNVKGKIHDATAEGEHQAGSMRSRPSDGSGHLTDKGEARMNDAAERRGTMGGAGNRGGDEVEDLMRSSRNGRM